MLKSWLDSVDLGWGLRFCIVIKQPADAIVAGRLAHTSQQCVSPTWKHHKKTSFFLQPPSVQKPAFCRPQCQQRPIQSAWLPCWIRKTNWFFPLEKSSWGFVGLYRTNSLQNSNNFDQHFIALYIIGLQRHHKTRRSKGLPFLFICSGRANTWLIFCRPPVHWSNSCLAQERLYPTDLDLGARVQVAIFIYI